MVSHRLVCIWCFCWLALLIQPDSRAVADLIVKQQATKHTPGTHDPPLIWIDQVGFITSTYDSSSTHWHSYLFPTSCPELDSDQVVLILIHDTEGGGVYIHDTLNPCGGSVSVNRRTGVVTQSGGAASTFIGDQDEGPDQDSPICDWWEVGYDCSECDFNDDGVNDCCDPPYLLESAQYNCDEDCDGIVNACDPDSDLYSGVFCDCDGDGIRDICDPDSDQYVEGTNCDIYDNRPSVTPDGQPTYIPPGARPFETPVGSPTCPDGSDSPDTIWDCPQSSGDGDGGGDDSDGGGGGGGDDGGGGGGDDSGGGGDDGGSGGDGGDSGGGGSGPGGGDYDPPDPGDGDPYDPDDPITDPPDSIDDCCELLLEQLNSIRLATWATYGAANETAYNTEQLRRDFGSYDEWYRQAFGEYAVNFDEYKNSWMAQDDWLRSAWDQRWDDLFEILQEEDEDDSEDPWTDPGDLETVDFTESRPLPDEQALAIEADATFPDTILQIPQQPTGLVETPVWNFTVPQLTILTASGQSATNEEIDLTIDWSFWTLQRSDLYGYSFKQVFAMVVILLSQFWGASTLWEEVRKH